jgi:3-phenylpropionate/cinnamic acid dioxygenase small subunit
MQRLPVSLTIGLLVASASVGWVWAQGRSSAGTLTAQDYVEIQQLYMRYSQGTDFGNAEMWLDVFTNDAIFHPGANNPAVKPEVGREALTRWRANNFANRKPPYHYRHWPGTFVITPTADGGARGRVYWMAFNPTTNPRTVTDTGVYDDVYVKTAAGWRIKERHAHSDPQPDK